MLLLIQFQTTAKNCKKERSYLKIPRLKGRAGSIPAPGTN
jgi:hypothetical protein